MTRVERGLGGPWCSSHFCSARVREDCYNRSFVVPKRKGRLPALPQDDWLGPRTSSPTWALDGGGEHATLLDDELRRNGGAIPMMMMGMKFLVRFCSLITSILGCRSLWSRHLTLQYTSMLEVLLAERPALACMFPVVVRLRPNWILNPYAAACLGAAQAAPASPSLTHKCVPKSFPTLLIDSCRKGHNVQSCTRVVQYT